MVSLKSLDLVKLLVFVYLFFISHLTLLRIQEEKFRETTMGETAFVGVDVGTGSARAALVSCNGKILGSHVVPIKIHNPKPEFYEQSSDDIWSAVCNAVQQVATIAEKVISFSCELFSKR